MLSPLRGISLFGGAAGVCFQWGRFSGSRPSGPYPSSGGVLCGLCHRKWLFRACELSLPRTPYSFRGASRPSPSTLQRSLFLAWPLDFPRFWPVDFGFPLFRRLGAWTGTLFSSSPVVLAVVPEENVLTDLGESTGEEAIWFVRLSVGSSDLWTFYYISCNF